MAFRGSGKRKADQIKTKRKGDEKPGNETKPLWQQRGGGRKKPRRRTDVQLGDQGIVA